MSTESNSLHDDSDIDRRRRVDATCDYFEFEWNDGESPQIEDALRLAQQDDRDLLLTELLRLEIELRRNEQQVVAQPEYNDRFPDQKTLVDAVFRELDPNDIAPAE